ncbi:MAG TPA: D-glycero-beta-D-manno-heptose 1,7-bisphosphate 7-phosphatase [Candidatus Polarisedimenticolia bacterium]|nr:D-glycero-beta-D-manno-heptose 1,7-bisphosphate 7-phosphatase [Candidatus Polarisedimenticolia bacterium]
MSRRAIFMDRDGTVSDEVGYINHIDRYRLLPKSAEAIRRINETEFMSFVITNQSGVARGLFDEALLHEVHATLTRWLAEAGARLDGIYYCPHHPKEGQAPLRQECDCRKPRPGLLRRAAREHGVDLASSYMIGDTVLDIEAAKNVGATGVLVLTGYGKGDLRFRMQQRGLQPAYVAADLLEAVGWILERERRG